MAISFNISYISSSTDRLAIQRCVEKASLNKRRINLL
jgi:hypothetical protein